MTTAEGAKQYFDKVPSEWDALYSHENPAWHFINKHLRKGLFERYELTFAHAGDLHGARVLDIGCGTGRFSIECAKRGASVTGIDFAPSMVEFSREVAKQMGVEDRCEFIVGDFLEHEFAEPFDVILALGVFDYVREPSAMMERVKALRPRTFVASYPEFAPVYGLQRFVRYNLIRQCPIYYYDRELIERLHHTAGFDSYEIIPITHGFVGVGRNRVS